MENWVAVEAEELGGGEYRPDAVRKYAYDDGRKPPESLVRAVRRHLLFLGWKIERMNFKNYTHIFRYRYTSPDSSKKYLSLNLLCRDLRNSIIPQTSTTLPAPASKRKRDDDGELECQENQNPAKPKRERRREVIQTSKKLTVVPKPGKKRSNFRTILSLLLENNVVLVGDKVRYLGGKNPHQSQGRITPDGIDCNCCHNIFSLSEFEAHAGSTRHRPSEYITLEDGRTLLDCKKKLGYQGRQRITIKPKRRRKSKDDKDGYNKDDIDNDYICSVCRDGGDLILCDKCPSAFHKSCICLEDVDVPDGDWFCPLCCCRICGHNKCQCQDDVQDGSNILTCNQCQHKFHFGCARGTSLDDKWFCSNKCENIFLGLCRLLGKPILVGEDNLTWTLLKSDSSDDDRRLKCALEAMHECFEPVEEVYTGRDIIEDVIFGRECELNRLNFRGFYTVVLEGDDDLISVANVRVLGDKVAEVPLVATRFQYRRLGMCTILMNELEKQLMELGVERLVLPSATVTLNTWVNCFGFSVMTDSDRREYLGYTFLDFQGAVMCQKFLRKTPPLRTKPG